MPDDWKGEGLISAKPKTREERISLNLSAASSIAHRRRQAKGCNPSRSKEPWSISIARWHKQGRITRGEE